MANWILDPVGVAHHRLTVAKARCGAWITQTWQPAPRHLPGEALICGACEGS